MAARDIKKLDERKDTIALVSGSVVIGTFVSLMAGLVPLAIVVTVIGLFTFGKMATTSPF